MYSLNTGDLVSHPYAADADAARWPRDTACRPVATLLNWLAGGRAQVCQACADRTAAADGAAVSEDPTRSPRILAIAWGRIDVEGLGVAKDVKLYPGGGREWDWSETGTRHSS
jgi:hypothetical protein